ncbi:tRNA (N(6)-L-threonylcarbamoyladenosine(37)-C(2))-methylthiotransferase MtaB [Plebeiibacterium marinum]|uniref:tRNA (N(6)-L-threonylcarbamoyladenosine(37)-C(2))-methylthiotransferase MtaB n=1 Tax=Plebeiibacterium marinum TaxID=2992111 RepID=A0AAE3SIB0_9BACT|nr:tRNA (N(6)-L-threonylcarbamoyladenosine(37)-C(2))-methylthiotransferase MtaB [Plebeiobacterium marinum]MCW3804204.1 tRNA (N(6)-L-threonylcarbamoyladenosine(37)-C(2))-methylthiotransferase MtaB [Plebeiobacterium marinum]
MIDKSMFLQKKVAFHTLGCKLNFSETSTIARSLTEDGFTKVKFDEFADVYVINTCSVTEIADKKCRQAIKKTLKQNPNAFVVVTGCFAQLKPKAISEIPGVDLVLGSNEKFKITDYLGDLQKKASGEIHAGKITTNKEFFPSYSIGDRTRTFLKIQDGCDYYCSYCTIPLARGRSRNADIKTTVALAQKAADEGAQEIILTGVNIGDFGKSTNENFFDLLKELDKVEKIKRFRISSIEPNLLTEEIIEFVAKSEKIMPHFHIPLQSGSNKVLALMKRKYQRELFAERINTIKALMPHAFIGVDVIVGVRGETKDHFNDAHRFINNLDISQLHVFTYSERPNTKALTIDHNVPIEERKRRSQVLHELSDKKTRSFYQKFENTTARVLFEGSNNNGFMNGYTENYLKIRVPYHEDLKNSIKTVRLNSLIIDELVFDSEIVNN